MPYLGTDVQQAKRGSCHDLLWDALLCLAVRTPKGSSVTELCHTKRERQQFLDVLYGIHFEFYGLSFLKSSTTK